jgi:hypothetical protein
MIINKEQIESVNLKNAWSKSDMCVYFSVGMNVINKLIKTNNFPKMAPVIKKWNAEQVKKWFEKNEQNKEQKSAYENEAINRYL